MATQYHRYIQFIRKTILDAGFSKSSGEPNITAFYRQFAPTLKGTGLKLSHTSFMNQVKGRHNPDTKSFAAMAVILSNARGEKVTVAMLDSLIKRQGLEDFETEVDESQLPDDEEAAEVRAALLLKELAALPIEARSTIAPKVLKLLGNDWEYLDSAEHVRFGKILQAELLRRGIGCEQFSKILGGAIPVEALKAIYECRIPDPLLTPEQVRILQENMRSIDGDEIRDYEMEYLTPSA